ncbi:MAG: M56 family metallopeptidase [Bacteroidota bacterium]|nr:M56 family metallopeptidase [Bacteroidota bacterium]
MAPFTLYLLKANGVFILLFAFYLLFLHRDTFYKAKRVYLLGIIVASVLLPLLRPAALIPQKESVQYVILLVGDSLNNLARPETFSLSTMQLIDLSLCVGIAGSLLLLLFRYLQLWWVMRRCRVVCYGNQKVYVPAKELNPFSYQGRIFLNPELYTEEELVRIIRHEQAHIDQKHGIDLMLVAFFQSLVWMNPLYYWFARSVRENIEFLADQQVLRSGQDPKAYQYALLKVAQSSSLPLTQHFSISHLKKRIIMMNKKRTHSLWTSKYLLVVPLLIGTLLVVNAKELKDAWSNADFSQQSQSKASLTSREDSSSQDQSASQSESTGDSIKQVTQNVIVLHTDQKKSSEDPLIIVNGKVISKKEMEKLDEKSITAIDVLKDKNAISKFGKKGKNGVIIISTQTTNVPKATTTVEVNSSDKKQKQVSISILRQGDENMNHVDTIVEVSNDKYGIAKSKKQNIIAVREFKKVPAPSLYILDDKFISNEEFSKIDVKTIQKIDVLKGETAEQNYGPKAKNGVIIITTKKLNTEEK